jgi:DNA-binding SARP family transcriptional activator
MIEAKTRFDRGQEAQGIASLTEALALARASDGVPWAVAGPKAAAPLYDRALRLGIERPFVQALIRRGRIAPPDAARAAIDWPWPVKLYTFGRFNMLRDGTRLRPGGKAQAKPLELLKLLIASGGRSVPAARLAETLWPEVEDDTALGNFETTLHRLRRLLGDAEALVHEDQCLSLDSRRVWVDLWAFERLLTEAGDADPAAALDQRERALKLYLGPFLKEESAAWVLVPRERLRAKYLRHAERLGLHLERQGDLESAIDGYLRGIEVDPWAEPFYLGLMRCYQKLERKSDALRAYQRCYRALSQLNMTPSPAVQSIYRALMAPSS